MIDKVVEFWTGWNSVIVCKVVEYCDSGQGGGMVAPPPLRPPAPSVPGGPPQLPQPCCQADIIGLQ